MSNISPAAEDQAQLRDWRPRSTVSRCRALLYGPLAWKLRGEMQDFCDAYGRPDGAILGRQFPPTP